MQPYDVRFDLKDQTVLNGMKEMAAQAHLALQKLEAGATATKRQKAEAVFKFLGLAGFYPKIINASGKTGTVNTVMLLESEDGNEFAVQYYTDNYRTNPVGLIGTPDSDTKVCMVSQKFIEDTITSAFPGISILETGGVAEDGSTIVHVSMRPKFMQGEGDAGFPLPSGSCACSDKRVAYMQAFVRMVSYYLAVAHGRVLVEPKSKTLAGVAEEKYGHRDMRDMVKELTGPNSLFQSLNFLRERAPERAKEWEKYLMGKKVDSHGATCKVRVPETAFVDGRMIEAGDTILFNNGTISIAKKQRAKKFNTRLLRQSIAAQKKAYLETFGKLPEAEQAWALIEKEVWKAFGVNPT